MSEFLPYKKKIYIYLFSTKKFPAGMYSGVFSYAVTCACVFLRCIILHIALLLTYTLTYTYVQLFCCSFLLFLLHFSWFFFILKPVFACLNFICCFHFAFLQFEIPAICIHEIVGLKLQASILSASKGKL